MFEDLNANKAYLLGFLLTDGSVDGHRYSVRIEIQIRDAPLLAAFAQLFGGSVAISHGGKAMRWTLNGKALCEELAPFTIVPNKTFVVRLPILPDSLMPHLLRGIWDGDGSFYIHKHRVEAELSSGSKQFVDDLASFFGGMGIKTSCRFHRRGYRLSLTSEPTKRLVEFLYPSAGLLCLERKRAMAIRSLSPDLNKKFWSEAQICLLKDLYGKVGSRELSVLLGRTRRAIILQAWRLGLGNEHQTANI
jgi:intein/homing endonuclease